MRVITGKAGGLRLESVRGDLTRPTSDRVKESLFSILMPYLPDAQLLDLYAGSGQLGIEALSRGAKGATFVDRSPQAVKVIRTNLERTQLAPLAQVWRSDAVSALKRLSTDGRKFDLIFVDPPYGQGLVERTLDHLDQQNLLMPGGLIIVEHTMKEEMARELQNLTLTRQTHYGETVISMFTLVGSSHEPTGV